MPKQKNEKQPANNSEQNEAIEHSAQTNAGGTRPVQLFDDSGPVELTEDIETGDRFVLYAKPDGVEFQLRFEGEEPWATQKQLADLFGRDVSVVSRHLTSIFKDGELDEESNLQKMQIAGSTKPVAIYSLDVTLAVGYRVGSKEAMMFRRWAGNILRQYLLQGYVIDSPRLKDPQRNDHLDDLLEEIAEIRASEANVWKRILELISACSDYQSMTAKDKSGYFAAFQNAMHWSVSGMTAGEIVKDRLDASKAYAGLSNYPGMDEGKLPRVDDGATAKNLYGSDEIKRLNMVTNLALDFLQSQAEQGRLVTVAQYTEKLRELLTLDGRPLIPKGHKGSVSESERKKIASHEIREYKARIRLEREAQGERSLKNVLAEARTISNAKPRRRKAASAKNG